MDISRTEYPRGDSTIEGHGPEISVSLNVLQIDERNARFEEVQARCLHHNRAESQFVVRASLPAPTNNAQIFSNPEGVEYE